MRAGARMAAWLLLTGMVGASAAAFPPDVTPMNIRSFEIPIKVDPAKRGEIKAIELFVSTDQGKTWQQYGAATPDKPGFPFAAQADGVYWFSIVVKDQRGGQEPPNIYTAPVGQKILIDTLKPEIRLRTERQGETVLVNWEVREEYPELGSFRLQWKAAEGPENWVSVPVSAAVSGQATIRANEAIVVQATLVDSANNRGKAEARVAAGSGLMTVSATGPAVSPLPAAVTETPGSVPAPVASGPTTPERVSEPSSTLKPPMPPSGPEELGPPAVSAGLSAPAPVAREERKPEAVTGSQVVAASPPPALPAPPTTTPTPIPSPSLPLPSSPAPAPGSPAPGLPAPGLPAPGLPAPTVPGSGGVAAPAVPAVAPSSPAAGVGPSAPAPTTSPRSELPVINNRRVSMEYEVVKYGPSGVGGVDLYVTRDDGLTWKKTPAEHQTITQPVGEPSSTLKRNLSVDLPEDGVYGFYLVVKSGAGLSHPAPRTGDAPQIRVKLDTKLPEAALMRPELNPSNKEALLLTWTASDENLAANPITIQWAERPTGPWQHIGPERMANTGSFSWVVSREVPPRVYLRLTVRDTAGNLAVAETPQPILVDLTPPDVGGIKFISPRRE